MPKSYTTKSGDTFSSISRALNGSEGQANTIKQANPHASSPLEPGTVLTIPSYDTRKSFKPDGLDIKIDGTAIAAYDSFVISSAIDGFRKVEFSVPNEIQTRDVLKPLQPLAVDIGYNGNSIFSGFMEYPILSETENKKSITVSASSWPNLLLNPPPISTFPVKFVRTDLEIIAGTLIAPYGIQWFFYADYGPVFSKLKLKQSEKVLEFLSRLAKQRALIVRDDEFGSVIFDDGEGYGEPVLVIDGENRPDANVGPAVYSSSEYYSHITGQIKSKNKRRKKKLTIKNPHYTGITKEHRFEVSDIDEGELETAVNAAAARMFAGCFQVPITVPGWTDKNGDVIKAGNTVSIRSPKDYIDDYIELLISEVTLSINGNAKIASLTTVLPGVYAGKVPEVVPWN